MKTYSTEAESHLIACALIDDASVPSLLEIPEDWFYLNESKLIYRAIDQLAKAGLTTDAFAVGEYLNQNQQLSIAGGMEYIMTLSESLPSLKQFTSFKNALFNYYKIRQLNSIKNSLEQQLETSARPQDVVSWLSEEMVQLMTDHHQGGFRAVGDYLNQVVDEIEWREQNKGQLLGQKSLYHDLDYTLDGFQKGRVYVLAGRPGSGKTAFGLTLADGLTSTAKPWFYFSLEMTGKSLAKRMLVKNSGVFNNKFRSGQLTGEDFKKIGDGMGVVQDRTLHVDETPSLSIAQIRSRLKAAQIKFKQLGGIVIDHIGLIKKDNGKTDTEAMNVIADELLRIAKEFDCPLVELCQLNRGVENRTDKRPMLADLKQSGKIEENADVVMLLYREDYYDRDATPITELDIAKNRDGETKKIYFKHDMALGKYDELTDYVPEVKEPKKMF